MPDIPEVEEIPSAEIYGEDLEYILDTLTTAYHFSLTHDLQDSYRGMSNTPTQSRLTVRLNKCRRRVEGILDELRGEPEDGQEEVHET